MLLSLSHFFSFALRFLAYLIRSRAHFHVVSRIFLPSIGHVVWDYFFVLLLLLASLGSGGNACDCEQ